MGKLTVTCFITVDNVVEDPHLWSMAYNSDDSGEIVDATMAEADTLLLGRTTYEGFAAAWPSRSGDSFADKINAMPKRVVSATLEQADWHNTEIIASDVMAQVAQLKAEGNVLVWGSAALADSLMEEGLVDELVLLCSPIVRGQGKKLFEGTTQQHTLRPVESKVLSGGMTAFKLVAA